MELSRLKTPGLCADFAADRSAPVIVPDPAYYTRMPPRCPGTSSTAMTRLFHQPSASIDFTDRSSGVADSHEY